MRPTLNKTRTWSFKNAVKNWLVYEFSTFHSRCLFLLLNFFEIWIVVAYFLALEKQTPFMCIWFSFFGVMIHSLYVFYKVIQLKRTIIIYISLLTYKNSDSINLIVANRGVVSVGSVSSTEPTDFWKVWNGTHGF